MNTETPTPEFSFAAIWAAFVAICIVLDGLAVLAIGDGVLAALVGSVAIPPAARAIAEVYRRKE